MSGPTGSRYEHEDLAYRLAEHAGDVWLDLDEARRDGYRAIARYLVDEIEDLRQRVNEALTIIKSQDEAREGLVDALLDVLLRLDEIDSDAYHKRAQYERSVTTARGGRA